MIYLGCILVVFAFLSPSAVRIRLPEGERPVAKITGLAHRVSRLRQKFRPPKHSLITIVTEIATRLNSGETLEIACQKTIEPIVSSSSRQPKERNDSQVFSREKPYEERSLIGDTPLQMFDRLKGYLDLESEHIFDSVVVALRFAEYAGCPLVQVLDNIAASLSEAGDAARKRRIAMAAPRMSARILAVLPLGSLGVITMFGVNPYDVFFHSVIGFAVFLAGIMFMAIGLVWSSRLVKSAEQKSE